MKNQVFKWNNTSGLNCEDDYRQIISDIYYYCFKGWCDVDILFLNFLEATFTATLHKRLKELPHRQIKLIEWKDEEKSFAIVASIILLYTKLNDYNLDLTIAYNVYKDFYASNIASRFNNNH